MAYAIDWFGKYGPYFLPATTNKKGQIDWNFLYATDGSSGVSRFKSQFWRANIDPTECLPGSITGSINSRLKTDQPRAKNLFLAGCWVRTGFDISCVESAVMAGMQAARAICGSPKNIPGEDLFGLR